MKNCQICNKEFTPKTHNQLNCSKECRYKKGNQSKYLPENINKTRAYKKSKQKEYQAKAKDYRKTWEENNKEQYLNTRKAWRIANPDKVFENNARCKGFKLNGEPFTYSDYLNYLSIQNNKCKICKVDFSTLESKQIHTDHCHQSSEVRGILCHQCNIALGLVKDSPEILASMIKYLEANK